MKAMRVLLVDENAERAGLLKSALHESGYTVSLHVGAMAQLLAQVRAVEPDVIIIDRDSPDRDTLEHVCMVTRDQPRPIVMFADDGDRMAIRAAVDAGVSAYVVGGLKAERIRPIVDVAIARFEQFQAMRQELDQTRTNLAERKQIERAKGIVMKSRGVSEEEAYGLLRKLAMERNQRIAQVAENVIAMAELLT
jgi:two-component system, response regulator / RNA-binding antiterminator